ncbi:hypothetical protein CN404_00955 [Bacillus thuringiensis]|uniref:IS1096 element passenger TnpR family protein n=1 Tax=Bacillus thuringiensis TaxID=1428 RepID=UPI000BF893B5|nr:hypothetical protein [Bacillus thuringiensis]PFB56053.1 hypothetical protein CN404_00955 [Bacillus thuringiensis]
MQQNLGDIPGYLEFLEAIKDPSNPQHKMYSEWDLLNFDPSFFDIGACGGCI